MVIQNTLRDHYFVWLGSHSGSGDVFAILQSHIPLFRRVLLELLSGIDSVSVMCFV